MAKYRESDAAKDTGSPRSEVGQAWHDARDDAAADKSYDWGVPADRHGKEGKKDSDKSSSGGGGWCFLATACTEARGLPDDCNELTVLRQFRDTFLRQRPDGKAMIEEYYSIAPKIVRAINATPEAARVYDELYTRLVRPVVEAIGQGNSEEAITLYRRTFQNLRERYLLIP